MPKDIEEAPVAPVEEAAPETSEVTTPEENTTAGDAPVEIVEETDDERRARTPNVDWDSYPLN